ncbi:MAG: quinolinate synthase NadA [Phycisphaerales bacterium]|nr:quinolinate synthase NadA [Phycisphaerales bacterium]
MYHKMNGDELAAAIAARREELGSSLVILGHHYQVDQIIRHADYTGDSLKLSQIAARLATERTGKDAVRHVIFCGVHFMAETADMLTPDSVEVILPDLSAGCSMADMAQYDDTVTAWETIHASLKSQGWRGRIVPITYVNSTAAIKAFVGAHGGACCTSSNADKVFAWAMKQGGPGEDVKILFLPDQHLGRNTAAKYGVDVATESCVYDPRRANKGEELGGATPEQVLRAKAILWAGHCSVHKLFRPEHCDEIRALDKANGTTTTILVHPECCKEVVDKSDLAGSTEYIIEKIRSAPTGSRWAVGTEVHLVNRLANEAKARGVSVRILSDCQCLCTTMYRIDEPHLLWVLDHLTGRATKDHKPRAVNVIRVHPEVRRDALLALDRMLGLTNPTPKFAAATALD